MDFLDPQKKRAHTIRLFIGYFLMTILIGLTTIILLFIAGGFWFDTKSGEVVQNGLVFVDSNPEGAEIFVNGELQKTKTNSRLVLNSGNYSLEIKLDGYRPWKRDFELIGKEIERFSYPFLIPSVLHSREIQAFESTPTLVTQSPDKRWMLVQTGTALTSMYVYDLNTEKDNLPLATPIVLSAGLFTAAPGTHSLKAVEWSSDNRHVVIQHSFGGGKEFVVIDREIAASSFNINKVFGSNPAQVALIDKRYDRFHLWFNDGGRLQTADAKARTVAPILNNVLAFKSYGNDILIYAQSGASKDKVDIFIQENDQRYLLRQVASEGNVLLDVARFKDRWYFALGSSKEGKVFVYSNPLSVLKRKASLLAVPIAALKTTNPQHLSFSDNARFIALQDGQHFSVYDIEYDQRYKYDLASPLDPSLPVQWMDGHRLAAISNGKVWVFDYDGINAQELTPAIANGYLVFNHDYDAMYNLAPSASGKTVLTRTELRISN